MEIIERAPAKINLGLDVLHKRVDGYHEVESIFASVDLADHLTFENLEED
ncbi:4-(cytidine 5'-diphospho)-2-C-methyl-D-erythritol kinase, partial [Enterococcus faecalis]